MKIKSEHLAHMKAKIAALPADRLQAIRNDIANDPRPKDKAKRFRWDLYYKAGLVRFVCDHIYPYADDTHIDTALRAIVAELGLRHDH